MIVTHPVLFNAIVAIFIAVTAGWTVFVVTSNRVALLRKKVDELEKEKTDLSRHAHQLEEELQKTQPYKTAHTPVIPLSAAPRLNQQ